MVGVAIGSYDGRREWVSHLAVDPSCQGTGIGVALVTEIETRLRKLGCVKVNLMLEPSNARVLGFYEKLGFEQSEVIFMQKWIS